MPTDEIRLPALTCVTKIRGGSIVEWDAAREELRLVLEVLRAAEEQCQGAASFNLRNALAALRSVR